MEAAESVSHFETRSGAGSARIAGSHMVQVLDQVPDQPLGVDLHQAGARELV